MSVLVIVMCMIAQPCDEATSPWVIRKEMTSEQCKGYAAALVAEINAQKLNPAGGFFMIGCRALEPRA